ncbi:MAG: hypothetical protein HYX39_03490 [Bacteroidetes bacterium]|nr:hypothetical protein [Bacteroidota bacterium]
MKKIFILIVFSFKVAISQTYTWAANNQNLYSEGMALDCDTAGNLYQAETYTVSSANKGVNVVKYDANHNLMWVQTIKGKQIVTYLQMAITSDNVGNVYFTCTFSDSLIVGSATYFAGASPAMLLVKFNAQGDYQWSKNTMD